MQTLRIVIAVLIIAGAAGGFWFVYQAGHFGPPPGVEKAVKPKVGGPFALVNHWGEPAASSDFEGAYLLVFFGYTFCPDVCPITLSTISTALDQLGADANRVTPLFITVDPDRDTPEHLREYVSYFHPAIIGLGGSPEQIAAVTKAYGVYYAKRPAEDGDPGAYLMDHTSLTYLMAPDGGYAAHFSHSATAEEMSAGIRRILSGG